MRVGIYRSVRVKAGCSIIFEHLMDSYADDVAFHEPGCTFRTYMRSPSNHLLYTVHEEYESEEAWRAHRESPHSKHWCDALTKVINYVVSDRFEITDEHEPV